MKILYDLFQIAIACAVLATAIFHPLCILAIASIAAVHYLGGIKERLLSIAALLYASKKESD